MDREGEPAGEVVEPAEEAGEPARASGCSCLALCKRGTRVGAHMGRAVPAAMQSARGGRRGGEGKLQCGQTSKNPARICFLLAVRGTPSSS